MAKTPSSKSTATYIYALGRRKAAVATVKLFNRKGESLINGRSPQNYFPTAFTLLNQPFTVTKTEDKFHYIAKIIGGGKNGQLEALLLALARALKKKDAHYTSLLSQAGLLTVDSRVRERRMVGTGGKARRQKQSPKR
jgi:small subunit ribosomal protein S9